MVEEDVATPVGHAQDPSSGSEAQSSEVSNTNTLTAPSSTTDETAPTTSETEKKSAVRPLTKGVVANGKTSVAKPAGPGELGFISNCVHHLMAAFDNE